MTVSLTKLVRENEVECDHFLRGEIKLYIKVKTEQEKVEVEEDK